MTSLRPRVPRTDQIAELTRGIRLPVPTVEAIHLRVIYAAVAHAWNAISISLGKALATKTEAEITALLQSHLNNSRETNVPLSQLVTCVVRGGESVSYDGAHLEKRPDLALYLTSRNPNFPLVVECKIIDRQNGKSIEFYCVNGLKRFVIGDYGWATKQGLMIAYVLDNATIEIDLEKYMTSAGRKNPDWFNVEQMPKREPFTHAVVAISRHSRTFSYLSSSSGTPGPIEISHMWLSPPQKPSTVRSARSIHGKPRRPRNGA